MVELITIVLMNMGMFTSSKGYDIDLSFYWKQVLINGFAYLVSILLVYIKINWCGIINSQKSINVIEDPLFYHIPNKQFTSEKCQLEV